MLLLSYLLLPLFVAVNDPAPGQIVRTELNRHPVARENANEVLPHASRNMSQNLMLVLQLGFEHRVWQRLHHSCHYLNRVFLRQTLSRSACDSRPTGFRCLLRQNYGALGRYRDGVLEMRAQASILGDRRPAVTQYLHTRLARIHHGLDRQDHPRPPLPIIRNLRIFMHPGPNTVADKVPDYTEPVRLYHFLYRCANIPQRCPGAYYPDGSLERCLGHVQQPLGLRRYCRSHRNRDRGITVVAVEHHPTVDRNDIPVVEHALFGGNAVHHLLVHRSAQNTGVTAIALKSGGGSRCRNLAFRRHFQIERGDAGLDERPYMLQHLAHYRSTAPHLFNFLRRLDHDGHRPVLLSFSHSKTRPTGRENFLILKLLILGSGSRPRGHDARHYLVRRLLAIHFDEPAAGAIMFHHRRRQRRISAHPFMEDRFRVIRALDQRCAFHIAYHVYFRRLQVNVVNALAGWTVTSTRDTTQQLSITYLDTNCNQREPARDSRQP